MLSEEVVIPVRITAPIMGLYSHWAFPGFYFIPAAPSLHGHCRTRKQGVKMPEIGMHPDCLHPEMLGLKDITAELKGWMSLGY